MYIEVNANHFDVYAPGYPDAFVTNVMVRANGSWVLVKPTPAELPLKMSGGDTEPYRVVRPPEDAAGGTISFHNYHIKSNRDGGAKEIVVPAGTSVTYTAYKNGSTCPSDWTVNGNSRNNTASIVFNRHWWDVPSWFIPSMDTPQPDVYGINAHDVQDARLKDSGEMTVVGVKRILGPNGKSSDRASSPSGGETWLESEVVYAQPCSVFNLTAVLEPTLASDEFDKIKSSITWSADSGRITPDAANPRIAECCAPAVEDTYKVIAACGSSRRVILVKVGVPKIHQVLFSGNIAIGRDTNGALYTGPGWKDDDLDGVSDLTGANADASKPYHPVAYLSTKRMDATGVFLPDCTKVSNPAERISDYDVEAAVKKLRFAPNDSLWSWSWSTPVPFNMSGTAVTAANPFRSAPEVGYEGDYELAWEVGFGEAGTADNNLAWHRSRSNHELYLTYKVECPSYETVFHISCTKAKGKKSESAIANAIWAVFAGKNVRRKGDDVQFKYWNPQDNPPQTFGDMIKDVYNANGSCKAWSEFLIETLDIQFSSGAQICQLRPEPRSGANAFLVKYWKFGSHIRAGSNGVIESVLSGDDKLYSGIIFPGSNGVLDSSPSGDDVVVDGINIGNAYSYYYGLDAVDQQGVPGQGNPNPPGAFMNHYIVRYGGSLYDPSYGTGPFDSTAEHENASIDGLVLPNLFVKKKGAMQELTYSP
ncbi:MAG: hypothetical protein IJI36_09190 [Kiritimatiellae bacterium]|nr:hypothetical protein [Kiritimatiellia bacterium]